MNPAELKLIKEQDLFNKLSKEELIQRLENESFERRTLSFYRYTSIEDPASFRDELYRTFTSLQALGRIYIAREGINAQMSIPEPMVEDFLEVLERIPGLENMPIKWAVEDDSRSFLKLIIKTRNKIVADGMDDDSYDVSNVGRHLSPEEFHYYSGEEDSIIVDMRNGYEFEIGHFKGAVNLESDTFREAMVKVLDELKGKEEKRVLLYCTGGIRCEKASSWLKHHGYQNVNQLHGGIIEYARYIKEEDQDSNFIGKNFVFDNRMGESINGQVISSCHICGSPADTFTNCSNDHCHVLFIQCEECAAKYEGSCSSHCQGILHMDEVEKAKLSQQELSNTFGNGFNNQAIRRRNFEFSSCST